MIVLALLSACNPDGSNQGVLVGNPGEVKPQTARSVGITYLDGTADIAALSLSDCYGSDPLVIAENIQISLLDSSLQLPDGTWCAMQVDFDGPTEWTVETDTTVAALALYPTTLALRNSAGFSTGGRSLTLELGEADWLDPSRFDSGDIDGDDALSEVLTLGSLLLVGDTPIADPLDTPREGDLPSSSQGCEQELETVAWLFPLWLLGGGLRRRQRS